MGHFTFNIRKDWLYLFVQLQLFIQGLQIKITLFMFGEYVM